MPRLSLALLLAGVIAGTVCVFWNSSAGLVLAAGLVLVGFEVALLTTVAGGFTVALIPIFGVNVVLLSSMFLWDSVAAEAASGVRFLSVPDDYLHLAGVIGIVFSGGYAVGALAAGPPRLRFDVPADTAASLGASRLLSSGLLIAVGFGGALLMVLAYQGALLEAQQYLQFNGPEWATKISTSFAPVAILALALAAARPGPWRRFALLGLAVWFLLLFARSSRSLALLPALVILGSASLSGWKVPRRSIVIALLATVLLLQTAIVGRGNRVVGIIPLAQYFTSADGISALVDFKANALVGNVLFSGPLTAIVANTSIPSEAFWLSLNPLPSAFLTSDWGTINASMTINQFTPFNSLGHLASQGWIALGLVAALYGYALTYAARLATHLHGVYAVLGATLVLATTGLFSLMVLQYQLRATTRLVWYSVVGIAMIWWLHAVAVRRGALKTGHTDPEQMTSDGTKQQRISSTPYSARQENGAQDAYSEIRRLDAPPGDFTVRYGIRSRRKV